jgi:hypothetical protein
VKGQKAFEGERIYCSDITGSGVRGFPDLVFEVERILHLAEKNPCGYVIRVSESALIQMCLGGACEDGIDGNILSEAI